MLTPATFYYRTPYCHHSFRFFFSVRLLSALRGHSVFSLSITFIFLSQFLWKSQYFPFECSVLNKGTTGTIFITSLVWRGPWLGIEPRTSALEASTLPLGYRWDRIHLVNNNTVLYHLNNTQTSKTWFV